MNDPFYLTRTGFVSGPMPSGLPMPTLGGLVLRPPANTPGGAPRCFTGCGSSTLPAPGVSENYFTRAPAPANQQPPSRLEIVHHLLDVVALLFRR
jgi:hypothetical protein